MPVRGIRAAITTEEDTPTAIFSATRDMLAQVVSSNPGLRSEDIASILFTVTTDLTSAYPARAAREMGWDQVPLMCAIEIPVKDSLQKCIRLLVHWNTDLRQDQIHHVYLRDAVKLRPDLSKNQS